jgi:hypothetical protein
LLLLLHQLQWLLLLHRQHLLRHLEAVMAVLR